MKRDERRQAILDLLVSEGAVDLDDLAQRFSVSKMTVHRDLDDLEGLGMLRKIRGGATIEAGTQFESDFRFRELQGTAAKQAMARHALQHVEPGMTVLVNDGSTAAVLGKALRELRPLTVITNNGAVIDALKEQAGITLIALGGIFSSKYNGYFGKVTEDALRGLRADIAFVSVPAVMGTEVFHMDEAVVRSKRAMMDAATATYLLVSHTRFEHQALHKFAELDEFTSVITDQIPAADVATQLDKSGIKLAIASHGVN